MYFSGKEGIHRAGVAIAVDKSIESYFTPITERICMLKIKAHKLNKDIIFLAVYAPTLPVSERDPTEREDFYSEMLH